MNPTNGDEMLQRCRGRRCRRYERIELQVVRGRDGLVIDETPHAITADDRRLFVFVESALPGHWEYPRRSQLPCVLAECNVCLRASGWTGQRDRSFHVTDSSFLFHTRVIPITVKETHLPHSSAPPGRDVAGCSPTHPTRPSNFSRSCRLVGCFNSPTRKLDCHPTLC